MAGESSGPRVLQRSSAAGHGRGVVVASPAATQLRRWAWQRRCRGLACCAVGHGSGVVTPHAAVQLYRRAWQRHCRGLVASHAATKLHHRAWQRRRRGLACSNAAPPQGMVAASTWLPLLQTQLAVGHGSSIPWPRLLPAAVVAAASSCIAFCNRTTLGHGNSKAVNGEPGCDIGASSHRAASRRSAAHAFFCDRRCRGERESKSCVPVLSRRLEAARG